MSMSYRPPGDEAGRPPASSNEPLSLIDRYSSIEGTFATSRDVRVEGVVRGRLDCQGLLYIAEGADIDATVEAASITVAGKLNGEVTCRGKLQITSTGRMVATVTTDSLVIDEGAFYEGDLNMRSTGSTGRAVASGMSGGSSPSVLQRVGDEEEAETPKRRRGSASS
jgi:cytoskeletal protein CcmA (bactofilin family)